MSKFTNLFIVVSRLFGALTTAFGAITLIGVAVRVAHRDFHALGWRFAVGGGLLAAGILYMAAPLSDEKKAQRSKG